MRQDLLVLDRKNTHLEAASGRLTVRIGEQRPVSISLGPLERIIIATPVEMGSQLLNHLATHQVAVVFLANHYKHTACWISPTSHGDHLRKLKQYQYCSQQEQQLVVAKILVRHKLLGQKRNLTRWLQSFTKGRYKILESINTLNNSLKSLDEASSNQSVMGLEGAAAQAYFQAMAAMLAGSYKFNGRNRRPPKDPINALLSLTYTLAQQEAEAALTAYGLDTGLGFLHAPTYGRASLGCDLVSINIQAAKLVQFYIDGPALRIRREGEATRWFPLRRIRQICITGQLEVSLETLFKLAEVRIPVTLFTASGRLRCQLLHPQSQLADLTQLLEESKHDIALKDIQEQWYENSRLQAYAYVGVGKGCVKLAHKDFVQKQGEKLNRYLLKITHQKAAEWMQGISQTGITRLLDKKGLPLHGTERSQLHKKLSEIAWPIEQQAAYRWLVRNKNKAASQRNLHNAMGELEQLLMPWFERCLNQLQSGLEQASYTATVGSTNRRFA